MSIGSVSAQSPAPPQGGPQNPFAQLAQAISSGNLQAAQQAYASLSQSQPAGQQGSGNSNNPFAQALSQIGSALSSGDIGQAQSVLQSMKSRHGHHHRGSDSDSSSNTSSNSSTSGAASTASSAPAGSPSGATVVDVTA